MPTNNAVSPLPVPAYAPISADDPQRQLAVARLDADPGLPHVGVVGDTYTILIRGSETAGRFTVIDMHVPAGSGPPPHRHDFEETFTVLEGAIEISFRGETLVARAGDTVNIPANAPHRFRNASESAAWMLCICSPAGQDEFFLEVGVPVATRTTAPPALDAEAQAAFIAKAVSLALKYRSELLKP